MMMITSHLMFYHKLGLFGLLNLATPFQPFKVLSVFNMLSGNNKTESYNEGVANGEQ